ncbi:MAG: transcription antitermination factor NusB [Candidatus Dormibacteraceae bacterium]
MRPRHQARELALKVLFQLDQCPQDELAKVFAYHAAESDLSPSVQRFAEELVREVVNRRNALDELIRSCSHNWKLEQMGRVDRVVLRIAIYEISAGKVPVKAAINESVDLAKTFSGEEAGRFVNGILGRVAEVYA